MKNILITGASRGIGRSTALKFASEGYRVFLNCRTSIAELKEVRDIIDKEYQVPCEIVPGDVSDPDAVARIFEQIYRTCKSLDVLVNNAGISHIGLLMDMSDEEWRHVIDTNLSSVFYCCRAAIPPMISGKCGRIINISSMWGTSGASCEAAYSASKRERAYQSPCQGTGAKQYPGQCHRMRGDRHRDEPAIIRRRTSRTGRRHPGRKIRDPRRDRPGRVGCCSLPGIYDRADHRGGWGVSIDPPTYLPGNL